MSLFLKEEFNINTPEGDKKDEALSIVLESAKLFHEHTVPKAIKSYEKLNTSEKAVSMYGVELERLGIEVAQ